MDKILHMVNLNGKNLFEKPFKNGGNDAFCIYLTGILAKDWLSG